MRQQLIKWLIEDVIPDAQKTKDPEQSILKFAHANNLAPAQVEMLGQLFNTAKTLSHLEKSASRGSSFPIIDVPALVADYLKMPDAPTEPLSGKSADASLPACIKGWNKLGDDSYQEIKMATVAAPVDTSVFAQERNFRAVKREASVKTANLALIKQAHADFQAEAQHVMETVHRTLRSNPDIRFDSLETDALALHGDTAVPVMNKLAHYLAASNWHVKRGSRDDSKRLIPNYFGLMDTVGRLVDLHYLSTAASEAVKQASPLPEVEEPTTATSAPEEASAEAPAKSTGKKKDDAGREAGGKVETPGDANGKGKGGGGKSAPAKPADGFFGGVNKTLDTAAGKGYGLMEPVLQKALSGGFNSEQQHVDRDYTDARHLATLQRLMTTDEVLSEADPEKVVSVYNTLRDMAPSLAGDANVMRVALRSAVQHDGISPFDIKSFLDTEAARQKTDYNRGLRDSIHYGGGEMGNRPA